MSEMKQAAGRHHRVDDAGGSVGVSLTTVVIARPIAENDSGPDGEGLARKGRDAVCPPGLTAGRTPCRRTVIDRPRKGGAITRMQAFAREVGRGAAASACPALQFRGPPAPRAQNTNVHRRVLVNEAV